MSERVEITDVGLTKAISIIYLLMGGLLTVVIVAGVEVRGIKAEWRNDIWLPAFMLFMAVGTLRRTMWGRWLSYVFSIFIVLGMPTGTLLGGYMLWHLTKFRAAFNRWY